MKQHYVLFPNQHNGIKLNSMLEKSKIKSIIVPTPRELSANCGISLLVSEEDVDEITKIIDLNNILIEKIAVLEKEGKHGN